MNIPTSPRRRWFSYSLRTMFLVVTLLAVFIAYHVNWIRQRREAQASANWYRIYESSLDYFKRPPPRAPGLLWLFGESGHSELDLCFGYQPQEHWDSYNRDLTQLEQSEVSRIKRLFPEARIEAEARVPSPSWNRQPE